MNLIRSIAFVLFSIVAMATFSAPASAQDGAVCTTLSQVTEYLNNTAAEAGFTAKIEVVSGEDAQLVRDYLAAKYANGDINSVIEFDVILFATIPELSESTPFTVALKDGCQVAQGPLSTEEYKEVMEKVLGK